VATSKPTEINAKNQRQQRSIYDSKTDNGDSPTSAVLLIVC